MDSEYKYDEQSTPAKNIAMALFAIANELSRQSENQAQQALSLNTTLKKELPEISNKITHLYDTINNVYSTNENEKEKSENTRTLQILDQLSSIADNLKRVDEVLRKHFSRSDNENYMRVDNPSGFRWDEV